MLTHDRDEELSMFLEMRRREKERRGESLLTGSDNTSINGALTSALSSETVSSQRYPLRRTAAENFLYSENEKSDYDWLLTPPGTPQFEKESHRSVMEQSDAPSSRPTALKSRLGNCREDNQPQVASSSVRRPSSSGSSRSTSRPSTPTRRSTTPTTTTTRPVLTRTSTNSRSSTPTSRATLTAARAITSTTAPARTATPTRTKTQPSKKPLSRPSTPTRRSPTPTGPSIVSSKAPSRGTSPTPTLKSSKPREMPGFSLEAPPNLRTSVSDRPISATRGRPGVASAPGSRSNSIERGNGPTSGGVGHVRRQSCSPSRGRAPIGNTNGSLLPGARGRGKVNNGDSPVAMGNKMVERVVNMRKLGPPRLTESGGGRGTAKSTSAFNSLGYGRNLSKSSIDMALRHMDIRRGGMTGNLRPLVTKVPASSMYSVRSQSNSVTNSPVATSSTVSSFEPTLDNINILCLDGNEAENDDLLSERSFSSPRDQFPKFIS
ncbi:unnamed protein product [Eruca vesicaria subsp. sativa]|uniref:Uncharacterized protein n=1 Tax=Eruca vesicaria subsp. sativa TaxID=29727 RepID=A0ABC8M4X3_ERUVS|nr:unnamed protein product [Eruca vesicaria subsp. sativa]